MYAPARTPRLLLAAALLLSAAACSDGGTAPSAPEDPALITPLPAGLTGRLAVVTGSRDVGVRVHVIDLATGAQRVVYTANDAGILALAWAPNGEELILHRQDGPRQDAAGNWIQLSELWRVSADGAVSQPAYAGIGPEVGAAYSPGGRFAFLRADVQEPATSWNIHVTSPSAVHPTHGGWYSYVAWAPGGDVLYYTDDQPARLTGLTLATGAETTVAALDGGELIVSPAVSPDGTQIAFVRFDGSSRGEVWITDSDGGSPRQLVAGWSPVWVQGGEAIAYAAGTGSAAGIYLMSPDGGPATRIMSGAGVGVFAISPH